MRSSIVYEFVCPDNGCNRDTSHKHCYVGHTQNTLSKRISGHIQSGAILEHFLADHGTRVSRQQLVDNTRIRYTEHDAHRLKILEALVINFESPVLNIQETGQTRILKLY